MKRVATIALVMSIASSVVYAGIRGPGKYCGVVIFDRWGGCTLYSSVCLMYISEAVKDQLRSEASRCVQIDATDVYQPRNPGDGLIKKFTLLGPAPVIREWESPVGLTITATSVFDAGQAPEFVIRVQNVSKTARILHTDTLAPTLLAAKGKADHWWDPSDGPSSAVVTSESFWVGLEGPRTEGVSSTWKWKVITPTTFERSIPLKPKEAFEVRLSFKVPPGEYQFLAGYGGGCHEGQSIASNLTSFDVAQDGTAKLVEAKSATPAK